MDKKNIIPVENEEKSDKSQHTGKVAKKQWKKPEIISGKEIGFFRMQGGLPPTETS